MSLHRASGLLLITSTVFSGTAVTKGNAIDSDPTTPYRVRLWDGPEVLRRVRKFPHLVAKFWYREGTLYAGRVNVDAFPSYVDQELQRNHGVPNLFSDAAVSTYPKTHYNEGIHGELMALAARFRTSAPIITIFGGATGSGKTLFAVALLHDFPSSRKLYLSTISLRSLYESYAYAGDDRVHRLLASVLDADFLVLDDLGYWAPFDRALHRGYWDFLRRLVEARIAEQRPTVLIETCERHQIDELREYLLALREEYPFYHLGHTTLDGQVFAQRSDQPSPAVEEIGMAWLSSKLERIEKDLKRGHWLLAMSNEDYRLKTAPDPYRTLLEQRWTEAADLMTHCQNELRKYRQYCEAFRDARLRFDGDAIVLDDFSTIRAQSRMSHDKA